MTPPEQPTTPPSVSPDITHQTTTPEAGHTDPYVGTSQESSLPAGHAGSPVGRRFGSYDILAELGRGGMGVVYKAHQPALNRTVALKMIRSANLAGDEELARFRAEAQSAARLQHPNIVTLYEIGEQDQMPFFSLEYVEGINLAQYLASNPQPASEAAALVEVLARAMHYAHTRSIIHRDLKPANVLLQGVDSHDKKGTVRRDTTRDSRPSSPVPSSKQSAGNTDWNRIAKITDFGLAKQLDDDHGQTVTGQVMGTPSYMAPEQAAGRVHEIGPLVDVYALGAILYKCLTGRAPFQGASTRETLHQVLNADPVAPNRLVTTVPVDLNTITLKCLEKDPARRYGSAEELADDLRRYLQGEPIKARPLSAVGRGVKWAQRNPVVASLSSLALTLFLVGSILVTGLWLRAENEAENARKETQRANDQREIAEDERGKAKLAQAQEALQRDRAEREAKEATYQKGVAEQQKKVAERSAEAAKKAQAKAEQEEARAKTEEAKAKAARQQAERSERDTRRALAANLITRAFEAWKRTNHKSACDLLDQVPPDLRQWEWHFLRRVMHDGHTQVNDVGYRLVFHPNGTHVAGFIRPDQFALVDLREVDKPILLEGEVDIDLRARFSPDGKILLAGGRKGLLRWEFPSGKPLPAPEDASNPVQVVAYAPNGKSYAAAGPSGLRIWSSEGKKLHYFETKAPRNYALDFDRESQLLVWLGGPVDLTKGGQLRIWETETGQPRPWAQERQERYSSFALHPERDELFLLGLKKPEIVAPRTGKPAGPDLSEDYPGSRFVQITPDGQYWVLRNPDGLTFVEASSAKTAFRLPLALQRISYSFTADSQHVVVSPLQGTPNSNFWSIKPRFEARWLQVASHLPRHLSFSPDSRYLLTAGAGPAYVWELATGKIVRTLRAARVGAWSPDGRWIATGNYDEDGEPEHNLRVYDAATGNLVWKKNNLPTTALAFTPDSKQLLVGSRENLALKRGKVSLLEIEAGKEVWSVNSALVRDISLSPQGDAIWTLESSTPHVRRYEPKTGKTLPEFKMHEGQTQGWAIAPREGLWLSFGVENFQQMSEEIAVRQPDKRASFLLTGLRARVYSADWHSSLTRIVSSDESGSIQLWDRFTKQELLALQTGVEPLAKQKRDIQPVVARFSPDGHYLIVGSSQGVQVYDGRPVSELAQMSSDNGHRSSWGVRDPDQKWSLSRSPGPRIECRSAAGNLLWETTAPALLPMSCAYHLDRKRLAVSAGYELGEIEVPSGKSIRQYDARPHLAGPIYRLAYSSDGKRLGCLSGGRLTVLKTQPSVTIWDVETGKLLSHKPIDKPFEEAERPWFSQDLSQIVCTNVDPVTRDVKGFRLWDTATGKPLPPVMAARVQSELNWQRQGVRLTSLSEGFRGNILQDRLQQLVRLPDKEEQRARAARLALSDSWNGSEAKIAYANQQWFKAQFHLERADVSDSDDPDVIYNLAAVIHNLSKRMVEEYRHEPARPSLERCLGIYEKLVRRYPKNSLYVRDYANTLLTYAGLLEELGFGAEAVKTASRGLELFKQVHRMDPSADNETDLMLAYNSLASIYKGILEDDQAKKLFSEAIDHGEQALKRHRDDLSVRYALAALHNNRASTYTGTDEDKLAIAGFQKSIDLLSPVLRERYDMYTVHDICNSYVLLADRYVARDESAKAIQAMTESLALIRRALKANPDQAFLKRHYSELLGTVAGLYARMGKLADADVAYEEALEIVRELVRQDPKLAMSRFDLAATLHNQAKFLLLYLDRPLTAELQYRKAEQLLEELVESNPQVRMYRRDLANTQLNSAESLFRQGKRLPALSAFQKALKTWEAYAKDYPRWRENHFQILTCKAMVALLRNRRDEVLRLASEMTKRDNPRERSGYEAAVVLMHLAGRTEGKAEREKILALAVTYIELSVKDRDESPSNLRRDPQLKLLHDRDDFKKLLEKVTPKEK